MGLERRLKRQKEHDVKKMYDKEMRRMAGMTEEQKVQYLLHLSNKVYPNLQNQKVDE